MDVSGTAKPSDRTITTSDYGRAKELKAFNDTDAGVKGLVDAGIVNIPKVFIRPLDELAEDLNCPEVQFQVPVIDLDGIRGDQHKEIVEKVRAASETWGIFQVVNHGIRLDVFGEMIQGACRFHEQDLEVKKEFHSRDQKKNVKFNKNYHSRIVDWKDTLVISSASHNLDPKELPAVCRDVTMAYLNHVTKLGNTLFELLSEALGLKPDYLQAMECAKGTSVACHYYPACPEPELTLGTGKHTDPAFLTILLQDQTGGLQVLHENQWADVHPIQGSLVVNIGDFLQILSNDKFKSVSHRVLANHVGPRVSVAFFLTGQMIPQKPYGPIKELTSEENPPLYTDFLVKEYLSKFSSRGLDESCLDHFKYEDNSSRGLD